MPKSDDSSAMNGIKGMLVVLIIFTILNFVTSIWLAIRMEDDKDENNRLRYRRFRMVY